MQFRKNNVAKTICFASRVWSDHISCVFDDLSNTNALGIPADGTADEKCESFVLLYQGNILEKLFFALWLEHEISVFIILIYELTLTH